MTVTTTITCDGCGANLTYAKINAEWFLTLSTHAKPMHQDGEYATLVPWPPPLGRDHHFCNLVCVNKWQAELK